MHRIDTPGSSSGSFVNGNPFSGIASTIIDAAWCQAVQDEIANVVEGAGFTLTKGTNTQLLAAVQALSGAGAGTYRNLAVNGGLGIWNRGTSFAVAASELFAADRFAVRADEGAGSGTATVSRQAFTLGQTDVPANPAYFLRFAQTVSSTAGVSTLAHKLEDVARFSGQALTVSFYAKAGATLPATVRIVQRFGSGGSPDVVVATGAISVGTSWQRFSLTGTCPSVAGLTIGAGSHLALLVEVAQGAGTFTLDVALYQAELSLVASPFEVVPEGLERQRAWRYFWKSYDQDVTPGAAATPAGELWGYGSEPADDAARGLARVLPTTMRAAPAVTWYNGSTGAAGQIRHGSTLAGTSAVSSTTGTTRSSTGWPLTAGGWSTAQYAAHATADAELYGL
jgi:hypothetical protein